MGSWRGRRGSVSMCLTGLAVAGNPHSPWAHPPWFPRDLEAAMVLVRLSAHRPTGGQSTSGHSCQVATGITHSPDGLRVVTLRRAIFGELVGLRETEM